MTTASPGPAAADLCACCGEERPLVHLLCRADVGICAVCVGWLQGEVARAAPTVTDAAAERAAPPSGADDTPGATGGPAPGRLVSATPVLASLDTAASVAFYRDHLGFDGDVVDDQYAIVRRDDVWLHFWRTHDPEIPRQTSCRVAVDDVDALYRHCAARGVVHPNAHLETKPWGLREFAVLDVHGNLVTFHSFPPAGGD